MIPKKKEAVFVNDLGFFQNQILGMKWLHKLTGDMLLKFGVNISSRMSGSIHFFLYDVSKITVLLCLLILLFPMCRAIFRRNEAGRLWPDFMELVQIVLPHCLEL